MYTLPFLLFRLHVVGIKLVILRYGTLLVIASPRPVFGPHIHVVTGNQPFLIEAGRHIIIRSNYQLANSAPSFLRIYYFTCYFMLLCLCCLVYYYVATCIVDVSLPHSSSNFPPY